MKNFTFLILLLCTINLSAQNFINTQKGVNNIDSIVNSCINQIEPDSIRNTIQSLQNYGTRFMFEPNRKEIAISLKNKFIEMGYANTVLDSFVTVTSYTFLNYNPHDTIWQYNVVATLDGSVFPDSICIAGAHYDSYSDSILVGKAPGADDNASGVAATIEIARIFKKMNFQPEFTVKFIAFAAEEFMSISSSCGSRDYADKAYANNEKIKFMLNNDMIANAKSTEWTSIFNSYTWGTSVRDLAVTLCQNYTTLTPVIKNNNLYGDSYYFNQRHFPALWFEENEFSTNYHTAFDVIDSINIDYCAEMTKLTLALLIKGSQVYTGINDNNIFGNQISVKTYPNPVVDKVMVEYSGNEDLKVAVCSVVGDVVLQKVLSDKSNTIDLSSLPKGIYLIKYTNGLGASCQKLIKN
jgi:hypothetical protein